jgi:Na+-translocating ferredoxin:NAD+ oxidoreductase RnfC subunit
LLEDRRLFLTAGYDIIRLHLYSIHISETVMADLIQTVKNAGIAGMGGGGFPAYLKLRNKVDVLIANGAECEPLMWSDYQAISCYADSLIEGIREIKNTVCAKKAIIAVKAKRKDLIKRLQSALKYDIQLSFLDDYYPAGDEIVLVNDLLGISIQEGMLPVNAGVLVSNVSTIIQIQKALRGEPFTSRFVTVAGDVRRPFVADVPIGTEFSRLIELAGGSELEDFAIMEGGVMMGMLAAADDVVRKTTSGIAVLPGDHPAVMEQKADIARQYRIARSVCDQCYACSEVCPRLMIGHRIEPHKIMRMAAFSLQESAAATSFASYCCMCGLCSLYACPLGISPRRVIENIRNNTAAQERVSSSRGPDPMLNLKRVPMSRLIYRLSLEKYENKEVQFIKEDLKISKVRLLMLQHRGEPAIPVVKPGDRVRAGDLVGKAADRDPALPVHASIDGKVTVANNNFVEIVR